MKASTLLRVERILMFVLPFVAGVVGLVRVVGSYNRLNNASSQLAEKQALLVKNQNTLKTLASYPYESLERAVARESDAEPIDFLVYLSSLSRETRADLFELRESTTQARRTTGSSGGGASRASSGGAASQETPPKVREEALTMSMEGSFASILNYVSRLETGRRIVAVSDLRMSPKDYPRLTANFSVTRFVSSTSPPVDEETQSD